MFEKRRFARAIWATTDFFRGMRRGCEFRSANRIRIANFDLREKAVAASTHHSSARVTSMGA